MQELRVLHLYKLYKFVMSHNILPNYLNLCIFLQYLFRAFFNISSVFLHYFWNDYYVRSSILLPIGTKQWDPLSSSFHYEIWQYSTYAICNIMQYAKFTVMQFVILCKMQYHATRSLGALRAPTSSWGPFGPLDFVLRALQALRPCDPRYSDWIVC